MKLLAVVSN